MPLESTLIIQEGGDTDYDFSRSLHLFSSIPLEANKLFSGKHKQQKITVTSKDSFGSAEPFNIFLCYSMLPEVEVDISVCDRWLGIFSFLMIIGDS